MNKLRKLWKPEWQARQTDQWRDLRRWRGKGGCTFSKRAIRRKGILRFLKLYGIGTEQHPRTISLVRFEISANYSGDRLRRFANYIDRTPALHKLDRVSSAIRRYFGMPDRLRAKRANQFLHSERARLNAKTH